ncbi:sulfotransferase [Altererythrobacter sp. B11]|uniref:sulfotransferase family protein n=1 Tax=Altererythrobacter sp. B11 TaxID=2060312 RepID=UPI000DC6D341|nr:sulfotransferase [Altererythrobacter sp. B11]BBC72131.1 sulfotransferase [Altererythrobacter sp. B11]
MISRDASLQPPRRTRFIDGLNGAMALARRTGLAQAPVLEKEALLDRARAHTGLEDFGDPWFEKPLAVLLAALRGEARLNAAGQWAAQAQIEKVLHDRLWAQQWFERHPEILERPLPRPVIVVGPMRSGTTRMHRLLSADRRFSHLRSFETISPVPRPDFRFGGKDSRQVLASRILRVARLANPRTLTIHPTGPLEPEEELGLLVSSFWGMKHEAQWWVPSYGRWCEQQDAVPAYRQMARLLQLIGWSQQSSSLRPWILKTPQHMLDLPALLKVFPDARLIFTHRDPLAVVGSAASLAWNQTIIYSDQARPEAIGREWLRKTALQIRRMRDARDHIPRERMIDVHYDDMESDWRGAMERVYRFLGLDIAPALPAMEAYQRRTARLKRPPHEYSLEEFGLEPERVQLELGDYVRTYGIAR